MGYSKFDVKSIKVKALRSQKAVDSAFKKANKMVDKEKNNLINEFDGHPVTKEIAEGPTAKNSSGTLGGYGNLFSFIGFNSSSNPIEPIKSLLNTISLKSVKFNANKGNYEGSVKYPSHEEIKSASPLPFESGRSWIDGMEKGISGFTKYIYKKFTAGRSGEGLQTDWEMRSGNFHKTPYLLALLAKFKDNIKGKR